MVILVLVVDVGVCGSRLLMAPRLELRLWRGGGSGIMPMLPVVPIPLPG